jgi:SAM-dependent methyltransferase
MTYAIDNYALTHDRGDARGPLKSVLDVGSLDVNGTHKEMIQSKELTYLGADITPGPNVDVVIPCTTTGVWNVTEMNPDSGFISHPADSKDIVITANTLEHVKNPFKFVKQLLYFVKPGGLVIIHTLWQHPIHYHPIDCWRILPDGMRAIFEDTSFNIIRVGRTQYENGNGDTLCIASIKKSVPQPREVITLGNSTDGWFRLVLEEQ